MYAKLRLPPQNRSFSRCSFRQTAILTWPNGRIEPNYFLYRDVNFLAEKKSCFFGSPECVWLLWASPEWKNEEKMNFIQKNIVFFRFFWRFFFTINKINFLRKYGPEIWESRVRRPGNHEWDDLGISSETTWESRVRRPWNLEWDVHRTGPEPDRNRTGTGPEPDRTGTGPEPDRNQNRTGTGPLKTI